MDSISKFNAAFMSMPSKLKLTAANFNLDFSLMRVEAPKEFRGVGDSLSVHHYGKAEEDSCMSQLGSLAPFSRP